MIFFEQNEFADYLKRHNEDSAYHKFMLVYLPQEDVSNINGRVYTKEAIDNAINKFIEHKKPREKIVNVGYPHDPILEEMIKNDERQRTINNFQKMCDTIYVDSMINVSITHRGRTPYHKPKGE